MGMGIIDQDLNDSNSTKILGSDNVTVIGNVGDALKVTGTGIYSQLETPTFSTIQLDVPVALNKSMISVLNSQSGKKLIIKEIRLINSRTTPVTGTIVDFRVFKMTGHSSGTPVTPLAMDSLDTIGSVTVKTAATISGESATPIYRQKWSSDEWTSGAQDVESLQHSFQSSIPMYSQQQGTKGITLRINEGLTIKQINNTSIGVFDIYLVFTYEDV